MYVHGCAAVSAGRGQGREPGLGLEISWPKTAKAVLQEQAAAEISWCVSENTDPHVLLEALVAVGVL